MGESGHTEAVPRLSIADHIEQLSGVAEGISHDFNNLLAAILANTEALLKISAENAEVQPYLQRIKSTTHIAIETIRNIQSFTEDGTAEQNTIAPADIVKQVLDGYGETIPRNCQICADKLDASCTAYVTHNLLMQSVKAIFENAIEALRGNAGTVELRVYHCEGLEADAATLTLGTIPAKPCVALEVEDSGEGISQDVLPKILDPFFTTRLRARGLGLTPVAGLIASNNNVAMQVVQTGQGTLFRILFGSFVAKRRSPE